MYYAIYQTRRTLFDRISKHPNTEKRLENTTHYRVVLTTFEVSENVVKHGFECLIYLLNRN